MKPKFNKSDRKYTSLLIGAGFSRPAGYPLAKDIGNKLIQLSREQFIIHTDSSAGWVKEGETFPNNEWLKVNERHFTELFIKFYVESIGKVPFNYENFIDFVTEMFRKKKVPRGLEKYIIKNGLKLESPYTFESCASSMAIALPHLVASLLYRSDQDMNLAPYARFFHLLTYLMNHAPVRIHSLNHDRLMERLCKMSNLPGEFSDGFTHSGSSYYSQSPNDEFIRLRYFSGKYPEKNHLVKLHGSTDDFQFRSANGKLEVVKSSPLGVGPLVIEETVQGKGAKYEYSIRGMAPNYLMGTNSKIEYYGTPGYYRTVFGKFVRDLEKSNILVVIGYSFQDKKINELISKYFRGKVFVSDITTPSNRLFKKMKGVFWPGGVEAVPLST
jgi:hypothetical protein